MVLKAFILGGLSSVILVFILKNVLNISDSMEFVWLSTSIIVAFICGCSVWIVKTIEKK
ncbi:MAG: hypothetical protein WCS98_10180 [Bacillota bacterium]|nr:hypothetical protein [Bacillota bacterium]MDD3299145.1 hypothetical protein [Bacillota bacterium]MDD3850961.1 hypothetical protein [Bacillota bacterium]